MTFVRVSSDIPVQSSYLPLISLYFMFSMLFTLTAFVWFSLDYCCRYLAYLPRCVAVVARRLRCIRMPHIVKEKPAPAAVERASVNSFIFDNVYIYIHLCILSSRFTLII